MLCTNTKSHYFSGLYVYIDGLPVDIYGIHIWKKSLPHVCCSARQQLSLSKLQQVQNVEFLCVQPLSQRVHKSPNLSQLHNITPLSSFTSLFQLCVKDHQEWLCTLGHSHVWQLIQNSMMKDRPAKKLANNLHQIVSIYCGHKGAHNEKVLPGSDKGILKEEEKFLTPISPPCAKILLHYRDLQAPCTEKILGPII